MAARVLAMRRSYSARGKCSVAWDMKTPCSRAQSDRWAGTRQDCRRGTGGHAFRDAVCGLPKPPPAASQGHEHASSTSSSSVPASPAPRSRPISPRLARCHPRNGRPPWISYHRALGLDYEPNYGPPPIRALTRASRKGLSTMEATSRHARPFPDGRGAGRQLRRADGRAAGHGRDSVGAALDKHPLLRAGYARRPFSIPDRRH